MTLLTKKEWMDKHGERPHHPSFKGYGWKWTPVVCHHRPPCYLDPKEGLKG